MTSVGVGSCFEHHVDFDRQAAGRVSRDKVLSKASHVVRAHIHRLTARTVTH